MAEREWTPAQRDAIHARGGTLLVSAAAGSGKTAVLVERIISQMTDSENPVDADRLLVVTFTKAAAAEMRQRITARVESLLESDPENQQLRRQQSLLSRASISTIHAFCMDLIRANFQALGVSSTIRTADDKELEILRRDCARECIEEFHERGEEFLQLVELLTAGARDDRRLFDTLFSLYDFLRAHPFYESWLERKLALYNNGVAVSDSVWGQAVLQHADEALHYAGEILMRAADIASEDEKMAAAYRDTLLADLAQIEELRELVQARGWDKICAALAAFSFGSLRPLRGDDPKKETVKSLRQTVKDLVKQLQERCFCASEQQFLEDIAFLRPLVASLFELVRAFDRAFSEAKRARNMMDFSDMEHYAIRLLVTEAGAGYAPTALAEEIRAQYDEILIDEFQDTNAAQEIIFRAASRGEQNLFMVGDVKQSIYRFRQAMPELFMQKKRDYAPYGSGRYPAKIILGQNFRSAPEITGAVNFFFRLLMSETIGEIAYTSEEALIPGAQFPQGQRGCSVELLDTQTYSGEADKTTLEARYVAGRIAEMLESRMLVKDGDDMRPVQPRDICILMRSPSSRVKVYTDALGELGVPAWAEVKAGFLTTKEIAPVIALLRVIDNPVRDIELASAMLSPLFSFTPDELTDIRLADREAPLYIALVKYAEEHADGHAAAFLETLVSLRRFCAGATVDMLIREIYRITDYIAKVQVMPMGYLRRGNLLLLVQYACDYHKNGYKGLSGFIGFVGRLEERGGDFSPASGISEQADVVRIMSIHRSKGLEFPIVFLCDCARQFNKQDMREKTLLHSELGFACVRRDYRQLKEYPTVPLQALRLRLESELLSEELRMLYVALTRAKEHLVLTGVRDKVALQMAKLSAPLTPDGILPPYLVRSAGSYLDWILMAGAHHRDFSLLCAAQDIPLPPCDDPSRFALRVIAVQDDPQADAAREETPVCAPDEAAVRRIEQQLAYVYPRAAETIMPTKMAVSALSKGEAAAKYRFARRPQFLNKQRGLTGAQRGNALHRFMQFCRYEDAADDPAAEIRRLVSQGFLSEQEGAAVSAKTVRAFFESPLAGRIFAAETVHRELRFLAEVGADVIGAYTDFPTDPDAKTAVQGVADCVFIEPDGAVIVDYKSDYVQAEQELLDRYSVQLEIYGKLLSQALGVPVKQCVIYSFALGRQVVVKGAGVT